MQTRQSALCPTPSCLALDFFVQLSETLSVVSQWSIGQQLILTYHHSDLYHFSTPYYTIMYIYFSLFAVLATIGAGAAIADPIAASPAPVTTLGPWTKQFSQSAGFDALPTCAKTCAKNVLRNNGVIKECPPDSPGCFCSKPNFQYAIIDCMNEACPTSQKDQKAGKDWGGAFCALVMKQHAKTKPDAGFKFCWKGGMYCRYRVHA